MQSFAQFALPGTIVASALGAVVLCTILLLYGFKSEPDDEHAPVRRLLMIQLGNAIAAACFAAALMLSAVALLEQRRAAAVTPPAPQRDESQRLQARLDELEQRLAASEARSSQPATVMTSPAVLPHRHLTAAPRPRPRKTETVAAPTPATDDFSVRAREDWESVKRGFREAGRDLRVGFTDLGHRIKHAFD